MTDQNHCVDPSPDHLKSRFIIPLNNNTNKAGMKAMFKRKGYTGDGCDKLVNGEGFTSLKTNCKCSRDRCKDTTKAFRYPGGNIAGEIISANAAHNMLIGIDVLNIWERTHRHSKAIWDVKVTSNLLELAERQATLEKNHDNKFYLESFVPYKKSDNKNNFVTKWDEFSAECDSIRGCTGIPLSYVMRNALIPKAEADDDEDDYATIDHRMIQRAQIIKTAYVDMDVGELEDAGLSKKTPSADFI